MHSLLAALQCALGIGITVGIIFWLGVAVCSLFFRSLADLSTRPGAPPPVTLLKPVYGLEKQLARNLRSACLQDHPEYQVVYSVQRPNDPALPILHALQREFGPERVSVVVGAASVGVNGKINNLVGALPHARYELLVISDSDVQLRPDFLSTLVAPLADPEVGAVSAFFRGCEAGPWYEQMEQLTLNVDQFAVAMLANTLGLVDFCFGASTALTKSTLAEIGGLEGLADFLVEDTEMGRRVMALGKRVVDVPYVVDITIDLSGPKDWWQKQTYWDQNTKAAIPSAFGASLVLRIIPLSLLFSALRGLDALGLSVIGVAMFVRLLAAGAVLSIALGDVPGLRALWLVPLKDVVSIVWFVRAFVTRTITWRGTEMSLTREGRLRPISSEPALSSGKAK
jgi:ceramide glucosyltransferase